MKLKCEKCGGTVSFCVEEQNAKCEHCETIYPISQSPVYLHEIDDTIAKQKVCMAHCKNCNMDIIAPDVKYDTQCPYCNEYLTKSEDEIYTIDGVIPFRIPQKDAQQKFVSQLKNRFFAPRELKKMRIDSSIKAMYFSAYKFVAKTQSNYRGYNTITDSEGKTHTEYYSGRITVNHNDFVEASSKLTMYSGIEHFDDCAINGYDIKYIAGFGAEKPDITIKNAYSIERENIDSNIRSEIQIKEGGTVTYCDTTILSIRYARVLLPMYFISYFYKNKKYINFLNGYNGILTGRKPISVGKIIGLILSIVGIISAIILGIIILK